MYYIILFLASLTSTVISDRHIFQEQKPEIVINADFPGGNISVDSIRHSTVYLHPDLRDTDHDWFYWYFSVKSTGNDSIRFVFTKENCLTIKGPAVSTDQGKTWKWLFDGRTSANEFTAYLKANEEIRFSMGMPYTQANFEDFISKYRKRDGVKLDTLCITPKGRATERLTISPAGTAAVKRKVLITARHHACEMMASYVLEGMISAILSDAPEMKSLRKSTEFRAVPFMDKDGVEDGDQGKYRAPRDHNRDYDGKSIHCSTAALYRQVPEWGKDQLQVAMDLHCPWIKGPLNEVVYLVGSENDEIEKQQRIFMKEIQKNNRSPLKFDLNQGIVAYGTAWNTASNTTQGVSFSQWTASLPNMKLSSSFEFPYSVHGNETVTPEKLRSFGRDLAFALADYLKKPQ